MGKGGAGAEPVFSGTWGSSSVVWEEVSSSVDESSSLSGVILRSLFHVMIAGTIQQVLKYVSSIRKLDDFNNRRPQAKEISFDTLGRMCMILPQETSQDVHDGKQKGNPSG